VPFDKLRVLKERKACGILSLSKDSRVARSSILKAMTESTRFTVVHADTRPRQDLRSERRELRAVGARLVATRAPDEAGLIENVRGADGMLVIDAPITRKVIAALSRCRVIVRYGVGVDCVDLKAATERGIVVAHVRDFCTEEVSNHALMLLLACSRKLCRLDRGMRAGRWHESSLGAMGAIRGETLGIVGLGEIGKALARKAAALGLRVVAHDPYVELKTFARCGARPLDLDTLLREADYVSLNLPLTSETRRLIGARELGLMKGTAYLVNTARGPIVDEAALVEALANGAIAGAGLDVFEEEPLPPDSPLLRLDNVVLTPHTAGSSDQAERQLRREVGKAAAAVLAGRWPRYVANPAVRERLDLLPAEE
jgi:D-3-phosphoglycerate dehydrogenase